MEIPVSGAGYTAAGNTVNFTLSYTPSPGTTLTVVQNTSLSFIQGTFDNLAQGAAVTLSYGGLVYPFVANYYGGSSGRDLVLQWAATEVFALGSNDYLQLGNNSTTDSTILTPVATFGTPLAGRTVLAVAAGENHTLALCSDGTLVAWGDNTYGQLGNSTVSASPVPIAVNTTGTALDGKAVVAIACGGNHNLALCSDGTLAAWGDNSTGQLGNGTFNGSGLPVAVTIAGTPLSGKTVASIAAGNDYCFALCLDGTLAAWGDDGAGQLGDGSANSEPVPIASDITGAALALRKISSIRAGAGHALAVCSDGMLAAWGDNYEGELGNDSATGSALPVLVDVLSSLGGVAVMSASGGSGFSLALAGAPFLDTASQHYEIGSGPLVVPALSAFGAFSGDLASPKVTAVSAAKYGTVEITGNGATVTYIPRQSFLNFAGPDSFTYTVTDAAGVSYVETVTVRNPYQTIGGSYSGLVVYPAGGANAGKVCGVFNLTLNPTGRFTGNLKLGGQSSAFAGAFNSVGTAVLTLVHTKTAWITMDLSIAEADGSNVAAQIEVNAAGSSFMFAAYTGAREPYRLGGAPTLSAGDSAPRYRSKGRFMPAAKAPRRFASPIRQVGPRVSRSRLETWPIRSIHRFPSRSSIA
jgi:hypothetical protein